MSAQIIQFPRKRPLEMHELPSHWPQNLKSYYVHVTYDGYNTHENAFHYCETMSQVKPRQAGESEQDYLLRRGCAALSTMPRRES